MGYPRIAGKYSAPRFTCRENVYPAAGNSSMYEEFKETNYTVDINDSLKAPDGVPSYPAVLPVRTNLLSQDNATVRFVQPGNMEKRSVKITYHGKVPRKYVVAVCRATDHFKVTPSSGVVNPGESVMLTVVPEKVKEARLHSGAFIFRLEDGWSVPVSVYVDARKDKVLAKKALFGMIKGSITKEGTKHTMTFDVPADGSYILFVRKGEDCANRLDMVLPGGKPVFRRMRLRDSRHKWEVPADAKDSNVPLVLKKGKCEIILQRSPRSSKEPDVTQAYLCSDWHPVLPLLDQLDELLKK